MSVGPGSPAGRDSLPGAPGGPGDQRSRRRLLAAPQGVLATFTEAGVLSVADVRVAERLARLGGEDRADVALAAALAVRATRLGSVLVDLAAVRETVSVEAEVPVDLDVLPWPEADGWLRALAASPLAGSAGGSPLRVVGRRVYLDRYWQDEERVATDLLELDRELPGVDPMILGDGLARLFADAASGSTDQRLAGEAAVRRGLAVVAGGPGTGKTVTVARILALLLEQAAAAGGPWPLIGLAAPTARAAARLSEATHETAARLDVSAEVREGLRGLTAMTIHRLLGSRPDSGTRFRHHRGNRLPHDVVVIDETSMVPLPLMARLLEAVRRDARLVLVGDPGQLASVGAGAVLGDVVGPAGDAVGAAGDAVGAAGDAVGPAGDAVGAARAGGTGFGRGVVVLRQVHRFGPAIGRVADAVRAGDAPRLVELLRAGDEEVGWIEADLARAEDAELARLRDGAVGSGQAVLAAALAGDASAALAALGRFMVLCAHRRGPHGVAGLSERVRGWLGAVAGAPEIERSWFVGQPLLVTRNDPATGLFNGEVGVVVAEPEVDGGGGDGGLGVRAGLGAGARAGPGAGAREVRPGALPEVAVFERRGEPLRITPARLTDVETVYAMTIHKSQGSQFETVAVVAPPPSSRVLTRELLFTAVTRATHRLLIVGSEEMLVAALERPLARSSGLRERLWGG